MIPPAHKSLQTVVFFFFFFLDKVAALECFQIAFYYKCYNFACFPIEPEIGLIAKKKFAPKTWNFLWAFQESIQRSDIALEGQASSILAQVLHDLHIHSWLFLSLRAAGNPFGRILSNYACWVSKSVMLNGNGTLSS